MSARGDRAAAAGQAQRRARERFVHALRTLDRRWAETFHEGDFYDLHYSDLFTELWLRDGQPVPRTEAYTYMRNVSPQTAIKYLNRAIEEGYLTEVENPRDGRSRLLGMSPKLRERMDALVDEMIEAFRGAV